MVKETLKEIYTKRNKWHCFKDFKKYFQKWNSGKFEGWNQFMSEDLYSKYFKFQKEILKTNVWNLCFSGEHNWLVIRNNSPGFGREDLYSGEMLLFKLEIKIKFYTIKSYKEQTRVRFNNIELYCSGLLWHETLAVSLNLHCVILHDFLPFIFKF